MDFFIGLDALFLFSYKQNIWGASQSSSAHQTLLPLFSTMCPKFQPCWAAHIFRTHGAPSLPPYFYIRCCFCTACLFLLIFQFTMYKPAQTSPSLWHPSRSFPTVCLQQPWIIRRSLMVTSFVFSTNYSCSWNWFMNKQTNIPALGKLTFLWWERK